MEKDFNKKIKFLTKIKKKINNFVIIMVRVKRGNIARKRRQKILKLAKGFRGSSSRLFRVANQRVMKSLSFSYCHRKQKKRKFRQLWIIRINAALHQKGYKYSLFIKLIKESNILLNRKMLANLAIVDSKTFNTLLQGLYHNL